MQLMLHRWPIEAHCSHTHQYFLIPAPLTLWPWMDDERKLMDIKWKNSEMRSMQSIRGSLGIEPLLPTAVTCLILYLYWFSVILIVTSTFPYQWILASPPKSTICTQLVTVSAFGETRTWAHISV